MNSKLAGIEPEQLALLASLFAIAISDGTTAEESATLSAFLVSVGDQLALIAVQQTLIEAALP